MPGIISYEKSEVKVSITEDTHGYNLSSFPDSLKISKSHLISGNFDLHDQLLVIYYNKFKKDRVFSFEHLCGIACETIGISLRKAIAKFRKTGEWNIKAIGDRKILYLMNSLLKS